MSSASRTKLAVGEGRSRQVRGGKADPFVWQEQAADNHTAIEALGSIPQYFELDLAVIEEDVFARLHILGELWVFHGDQVFVRGDLLVREPELSPSHKFQCPAEFGVSGAELGAGEVHKDADGLAGHCGDLAYEVDRNDVAIEGAVARV
jgi:hypothetical protein